MWKVLKLVYIILHVLVAGSTPKNNKKNLLEDD